MICQRRNLPRQLTRPIMGATDCCYIAPCNTIMRVVGSACYTCAIVVSCLPVDIPDCKAYILAERLEPALSLIALLVMVYGSNIHVIQQQHVAAIASIRPR